MISSNAVLLDTCAVIWLGNGDALSPEAKDRIAAAGAENRILVSPISAWEVGLLARPRPNRAALTFLPDPKTWFARFLSGAGISETPLTPAIAIDSSSLPGNLHGDPADRLIIATARHLQLPVVTRDRNILAYGAAGHVAVVAC